MKILVVSQYFWPENFRINDLVREWKKRNYEVEVLTGIPNYPSGKIFQEYKKEKNLFNSYHGAQIHRVPMMLRGSGSNIKIFLNYLSFSINSIFYSFFKLRKKKYDIIFTFGTSPITVSLISIFISKFTNSKNVIWLLDLWPNILSELKIVNSKFFYKVISFVVNYIYKNNHLILAQSDSFKQILCGSVDQSKIDTLYSWPEKINYELKTGSKELQILPEYLTLIFTGAIGEAQNFEDIITVFKFLKDKKVRLIVIGDGRKKEWIKKEINKYNLNNILLIKNKPLQQMPEYVYHADVLFFSLKSGKFGSSTIPGKLSTYLNYNKPILCHTSGESQKIVKDNNFGLVSEPGDINKLLENIKHLIDLKKSGTLNDSFNNSENFKKFNFQTSFSKINNQFVKLKYEKDKNKLKLIENIKDIPFNHNFIMVALNLAFIGFLKSKDLSVFKNTYLWADGIFAKRFYNHYVEKISGRKLIQSLSIPKSKDTIHVVGNLTSNSTEYLNKRFNLKIRHTPMPFANINDLKKKLPKIYSNEVIFLTLPTPKQEVIANELANSNENYTIFCVGGALNMLAGDEPEPPGGIIENNFEFLWRLKFDTKRRIVRLFKSMFYYLLGEISWEYKKYDWDIYKK